MRALVLLAICAACAVARADEPPRDTPAGFDHHLHARDVDVAPQPPIACEKCHAMRGGTLVGRPGHAACLGACHGALPTDKEPRPIPPQRMRVCTACHAEATLVVDPRAAKKPSVAYPPYKLDLDFALQIGHKSHAEIACATCHDRGPATPHRRCIACHDGAPARGFAMTACVRCHQPGSGKPDPVGFAVNKVQARVTSAFSHGKHAARGGAGAACATCHHAILATDDRALPHPAAKDCATAGCHDGTAAFGITAACTRCHKDVPAQKYDVYRHELQFTHHDHNRIILPWTPIPCVQCHELTPTGQVLPRGHTACLPCHEHDFADRKPHTCTSCHNGSEPWRPLVPDRLPAERTEFGADLDHKKHGTQCASCHVLTTSVSELRPPRGHAACIGTACHARTTGPEPHLDACEACHVYELVERRAAERVADAWSVRAAFRHEPHARNRLGEVACRACHDDLASPTILELERPAKARCVPCHDGRVAFKVTGTTCSRCHGGKR